MGYLQLKVGGMDKQQTRASLVSTDSPVLIFRQLYDLVCIDLATSSFVK